MVRSPGPSQKCLQGRGAPDPSGEQPQQQCHIGVHVDVHSGVVMVGQWFDGFGPRGVVE